MRWTVFLVAVAVSAVAVWWLTRVEEPVRQVELPAPVAAVEPTFIDAATPVDDAGEVAVAPLAPLPPVNFAAGFCAVNGELESVKVKNRLDRNRLKLTPELKRALAEAEPVAALQALAANSPQDLDTQLALAMTAEPESDVQVAALRRARALAPRDAAIGWAMARATSESADLDDAIDGLSAFLAVDPQPAVSRMRARLEVQRDIQAGDERMQRSGITLLWPAAALTAVQADGLIAQVARDLDDAARLTGTRRRTRLTVVVYNDRSELLAVACAQAWTVAMYDGTLRVVATKDADGYNRTTLKHETLHSQAALFAPNAPKWFHEGLAQSFAQQIGRRRAWVDMVKGKTWIPFSSLDGTFQAFTTDADADLAYGQAYAMVELLRERAGDGAIPAAMAEFEKGATTPQVLARVLHQPEVTGDELLEFMKRRLIAAQNRAP